MVGFVSKYALLLIVEEFDRIKHIRFDNEHCGCVLRQTYGLPCAYELARYDPALIPMFETHITWTRLSFSNISSIESQVELCI